MDGLPPISQSFPIRPGAIGDDNQLHQYSSSATHNPITATATSTSSSTLSGQHDHGGNGRANGPNDDGQSSGSTRNNGGPSSRIRRRNRMITSCLECRRRKLKCDRLHPCTNCAKFRRDCVFLAPVLDNASRLKLAELKEKMGSLERVLEQDVAGKGGEGDGDGQREGEGGGVGGQLRSERAAVDFNAGIAAAGGGSSVAEAGVFGTGSGEEEQDDGPEDETYLEPTRLAVQDAAYEDEADDDTFDLGFRLGKMRMTDRVGGLYRPKISDELTLALKELAGKGKSPEERARIAKPPRLRDLLPAEKESYFNPGPSFIAPRSELFFGSECGRKYTLIDFLPSKFAADNLTQRYWESVHPVAKVVHRPSFEKRYEDFWADMSRGLEPSPSLQALVFAAMFSGVSSMTEHTVLNTFGVPQKNLIENFQLGTEMGLGKANFLRTTKTETMQALVMYMIPMCRAEISRAHSALVGAAIRLAECMGFHRDPSEYGLPPIETHVRRMIWYQLCFLDLRTSETQGPRPTIRREDFSTRFPLNVDDVDLQKPSTSRLRDLPWWTDMTFTRIRMECCELLRILFHDNIRLEKKSISITHVLGKIESFRKASYAKYGPLVSGPNQTPAQRAASLVLSVYTSRLYISVLHRYHNSVTVRIPDRLRQIILTAGTQQMEDAIELETSPELQPWAWYCGAYQQFHTAFLLLFEVFIYPMRREADRIWRCLDYVFETQSSPFRPIPNAGRNTTRKEIVEHRAMKGALILTQLRDRMSAYREMRGLKIPVRMRDSLVYMRPRTSTGSQDILYASAKEVQLPEQIRTANTSRPEGHPTGSMAPPLAGVNLPSYLASSSAPSYLPYSTQTSQPGMAPYQPLAQSQSHPQSQPQAQAQAQGVPQYQSQTQTQSQLYPPWQPQSQSHSASAQGPSYSTATTMPPPAQRHEPSTYNSNPVRGRSIEIDGTGSEDSGSSRLWFMSSIETPGAGAAPPIQPAPAAPPAPGNGEDMMMLDINWNEWDKLFPPEINNGDLNLPSPSMEELMTSMDTSFDDPISYSDPIYYQQPQP